MSITREMVHLAIDGMWHVFKLQHSTPRNDFCRIAAKNGILVRLVNVLHSVNEAARLASVQNGAAARPRSGPLDAPHTIGAFEPLVLSASSTSGPVATMLEMKHIFGDEEKNHIGHAPLDASLSSKASEVVAENSGHMSNRGSSAEASEEHENFGLWKPDASRLETGLLRQQRATDSASRTSTDKPLKHVDLISNGHSSSVNPLASQKEQVRPLLSLFDKEPPSRNVSGQLDYVRNLPAIERHESILPLLHSSTERKTNGELELLMAEFAGKVFIFF